MLSKLIRFDLPLVKASNSLCLRLQCDSLHRKLGKSLIPLSVGRRKNKKSHQFGICHIRSPRRRNEGHISAAPLSGNRAPLPALILSCKCYFLPPPNATPPFHYVSIVFCSFHVHSTCKSSDQGARLRVLESCKGGGHVGAPHKGITRSALWGLLLTII